jgi:Endonuclease/Exonuclease/phosphatase family
VLNELHGGLGPELLGVAEVEGDKVFAQLLADTGNSHLKVVTDPTPPTDLRAIDVSIAHDDRKLRVVGQRSHMVPLRYPTRDIFEVVFEAVETSDPLVVIAGHWPSRRQGKEHSEPARMAVAENLAFLVRDHVRFQSPEYLQHKADGDLAAVQAKLDTPVLIMGDFNDEPSDASVIGHLQASSELDQVVGPTNQITRFETEVATYRSDDTWLYNACWIFLAPENLATFFIESTSSGEHFANCYQVLDNLVASRGLLRPGGVTLDPGSVDIYRAASVATPSG